MREQIDHIIHHTIAEATSKMATSDVIKAAAKASRVKSSTIRNAVQELVNNGELRYTYVHGTSFLERSFERPVRISRRIVIKPPERAYEPKPGELVLNIAQGAAFGIGAHPSTRLALGALDASLGGDFLKNKGVSKGLDVGTGSGILAIALARLGVIDVVGTDIDPCAVSEATNNVAINGLAEQVAITSEPVEKMASSFAVIVANLAFPTLAGLSKVLMERLRDGGLLVLSGFKTCVSKGLSETYTGCGGKMIAHKTERDWACLIFCRTAGFPDGQEL